MSLLGILVLKAYPESLKPLQRTSILREIQGTDEQIEHGTRKPRINLEGGIFCRMTSPSTAQCHKKRGRVAGGSSTMGARNATGGPGLPPSLNKDTFGGNSMWTDYYLL